MGWGPMNYIKENLLPNVGFEPNRPDGDMLHRITYPTDSLLTANHVADGDDIIYAVDGVYFDGAILDNPNTTILIRCLEGDTTDYMIAGCAPNAAQMSGKVEAIAYSDGKLDLTLFGNSLTNRAFQRDDYTYASNTIYTKVMLSDVPMDHWGVEGIDFVMEKGLMNGTSATAFSPSATTTRGMIVTILYRMDGSPAAGSSAFADVAPGAYYASAVAWASANGIVTGYEDGSFGPEDPITREQMAAFLFRYARYKGLDVSAQANLSGYTDAGRISPYAVEPLRWANALGLITGTTADTISPTGSATREQAAVILTRFIRNTSQG